jgi:D-ribose pyranose/furanose isomerase RbsD
VDISRVDDVPAVLQVLTAARGNCNFPQAYMAKEFQKNNIAAVCGKFAKGLQGFRPHSSRTWNSKSACPTPPD